MPRLGLDVNVTEKINTSLDTQLQPHVTEYDHIGSHRSRSARRFGQP